MSPCIHKTTKMQITDGNYWLKSLIIFLSSLTLVYISMNQDMIFDSVFAIIVKIFIINDLLSECRSHMMLNDLWCVSP